MSRKREVKMTSSGFLDSVIKQLKLLSACVDRIKTVADLPEDTSLEALTDYIQKAIDQKTQNDSQYYNLLSKTVEIEVLLQIYKQILNEVVKTMSDCLESKKDFPSDAEYGKFLTMVLRNLSSLEPLNTSLMIEVGKNLLDHYREQVDVLTAEIAATKEQFLRDFAKVGDYSVAYREVVSSFSNASYMSKILEVITKCGVVIADDGATITIKSERPFHVTIQS